jgi:endoglucanase
MDQMFIDVGATSKDDCPVKTGDIGIFDREFVDLGQRVMSKAMDDRIAAAVLVEVIRRLKTTQNEVYFVFSVQEEVGLRGATTSAYGIDPDIGISVDVTMTGDTPKGMKMDVSLGKGPAIKVKDGGMISDPRLVKAMVDAAEKVGIPYQMEILVGGTTDARAMQVTRAGVPAGCVSIPTRYVHSPSEMVDMDDVENAIKLLVGLVKDPIHLA